MMKMAKSSLQKSEDDNNAKYKKARETMQLIVEALKRRDQNPDLANYQSKLQPGTPEYEELVSKLGGRNYPPMNKSKENQIKDAAKVLANKPTVDERKSNDAREGHMMSPLAKAQYAKTAPVEERKAEKAEKKKEAKIGKKFAEILRKKATNMMKQKSGANPGKGISSETPKKTLREPNKVKPAEAVNPKD